MSTPVVGQSVRFQLLHAAAPVSSGTVERLFSNRGVPSAIVRVWPFINFGEFVTVPVACVLSPVCNCDACASGDGH